MTPWSRSFLPLLLLCWSASALAADWYASPTGTAANSGTSPADATSIYYAGVRASAGDTIFLLPGTYLLTGGSGFSKDLTVSGAGIGSTIIDCSIVGTCFSISMATHVTLKDMTIQNGTSGPAVQAIDTGVTIRGVEFLNNYVALQIRGVLGLNSLVTQSRFIGQSENGIFIYEGVYVDVRDNIFSGNHNGVLLGDTTSTNAVRIQNNTFTKNDYGINLISSSTTSHLILGNDISDSLVAGIISSGSGEHSTVEANTITGGPLGIKSNGSETTFVNNLITSTLSTAVLLDNSAAILAYNTIDNCDAGVLAANTDESYVYNNIITHSARFGLKADATSSLVTVGYNDSFNNPGGNFVGAFTNAGGNLSVAPRYRLPGADYRLDVTSPLLNMARLFFVNRDHDGRLRDAFTPGSAIGPEIGAFEHY